MHNPSEPLAFLRMPDVQRLTGLSRTEIYRRISEDRFPKSIRLSHRVAVWKGEDIQKWISAESMLALSPDMAEIL